MRLAKLVGKVLVVVLLGGFLGASLVRFAPGFGIDEGELDIRLSDQSIRALRQIDGPKSNVEVFYLSYLRKMIGGDLGTSRTLERPVSRLLAERFPETLKSVGSGLALGWLLGLSLAVAVVQSRAWYLNWLASFVVGVLLCLPAAVLALLFVVERVPARLLLSLVVFPKVFRYAQNLLERCAALPHVITARAKGLGNVRVMLWHVLPPALPQLAALVGVSISLAFAASIPMEALCDLPGIGQLAWKAALGRDVELLVNLTMIVTLVTLLANTAGDLAGGVFQAGAP